MNEHADTGDQVSSETPITRIFRFSKPGPVGQAVLASALTTIAIFAIVAGIVWAKRSDVLAAVVAKLPPQTIQNTVLGQNEAQALLATAQTPKDLSVSEVFAKTNKSVVSIEVSQTVPTYSASSSPFGDLFPGFFFGTPQTQTGTEERKVGGGTGFFVSSDGMIVTNRHVVDFENATFTAITIDGKKYKATVLARDPVLDVAILKVTGSGFQPVTLGTSSNLEPGQGVVAIGFALGEFKNSVSAGVISGLSRSITAGDGSGNSETLDEVIQTDAAINPGNSGGPLLNLRGEVIGINVAVAEGSQNVGFALPIDSVKPVIDSVKKNGTIVRPYVGIRYVQITSALARANNLSVDYGILVSSSNSDELAVIPGSPADIAGIRENDIILSVDGKKLDDSTSFATIIRSKKVGQTISLEVLSKGVRKTVSVTLAQAPTL